MANLTLEGATKSYKRPKPQSWRNLFSRIRGGEASDVAVADTADTEEDLIYALNGLDLQIDDGESVSVLGPSGCGKTALLRILAGLEHLDGGKIFFDGEDMTTVSPQDRNVAMVFQDYALYPHWAAQDNLGFFFKTHQRKDEIPERVRLTARVMGLGFETLLSQKPPKLSGGQQQRVAIARAIIRDPRAFLFDEPLSNLDATVRARTRVEIKRLIQRFGITSVYVTHDQAEAMTMGDRIAVMKDGEVQQVAAPLELYEKPVNRFVAGFIGSPGMNFLEGRVVYHNGHAEFDEGSLRLPIPDGMRDALAPWRDREVTFGIRPEDITSTDTNKDWKEARQIRATVEVVEPMGSETFLYMTTGRYPFIARVDAFVNPDINTEMPLLVNMARAHFFSRDDEAAIV